MKAVLVIESVGLVIIGEANESVGLGIISEPNESVGLVTTGEINEEEGLVIIAKGFHCKSMYHAL